MVENEYVRPDIDYPDYLPEDVRTWAREHRELLELVVEELLRTGTWTPLKDLTRKLAREGHPAALRPIFWEMPKPLGFINNNPERVILTLFGLRATYAGHKLLAGFTAILTIAVERYAGDDSDPVIKRADAARGTIDSNPYVTALSDILLHGAPFLGSGTGGPEDDWTREITDDVVRYFNALSTETYLRTRARELTGSPQLGWGPLAVVQASQSGAQGSPQPRGLLHQPDIGPITTSNGPDEQRDVFISHAGEDKDSVARPLSQALLARGWKVWLDELELTIGDSLSGRIDAALAQSHFGVVVLSPAFFAKEWPQRELAGLAAREVDAGTKVILPVWHNVDRHYVAQRSPILADRVGALTAAGIDDVAARLSLALERAGLRALENLPRSRSYRL